MVLTATICKSAKPRAKTYKLTDSQGLYLEITPTGSRYWRLKYRYGGKEKRLALGVYPQVSLAEAREAMAAAKKAIKQGIDPSLNKRELKRQTALNAANTFEAIALEWHEHSKERWSENHSRTVMRRLERDLFPSIGQIPIKDITAPILLKAIRDVEKRGAHEIARRALQVSGQVFMHAIRTGRAERNWAKDLDGALKPVKRGHYAAMEINELPEFMRKLHTNEGRLFLQTRLAVEMMLLTFVRTGELIKAKWNEFDFEDKIWIVPAERMKMRQSHIVPLAISPLTESIMNEANLKQQLNPRQQAETMCALLGRAVWAIQHLEDALSHSMALKHPRAITRKLSEQLLESNRQLTLGKAVKQAKEEKAYDESLQGKLEAFLVERNWLVHKCMRESADEKGMLLDYENLFKKIKDIESSALFLKEAIEIDMLEFGSLRGRDDIRESVARSYLEHLKMLESA